MLSPTKLLPGVVLLAALLATQAETRYSRFIGKFCSCFGPSPSTPQPEMSEHPMPELQIASADHAAVVQQPPPQPMSATLYEVLSLVAPYLPDIPRELFNFSLVGRLCPALVRERLHGLLVEGILVPWLIPDHFIYHLAEIVTECRRTPTLLAALKNLLTDDANIIYIAQRLCNPQPLGPATVTAFAVYFISECECPRMAGYLIGHLLMSADSDSDFAIGALVLIVNQYLGQYYPLAEVRSALPGPVRDLLMAIPERGWAASYPWEATLPIDLFERMPWHDSWQLQLACGPLVHDNPAALSALLQLGVQIRLEPDLWPNLTVQELRRMAPYLRVVDFGNVGLRLLAADRYDLFVEVLRHGVLIASLLETTSSFSMTLLSHAVLRCGIEPVIEAMSAVPPLNEFLQRAREDQYYAIIWLD